MRIQLVSFFLFFLPFGAIAQGSAITFEQYARFSHPQPKPLIVLLTSSWCKYCQAMKQTLQRYQPESADTYLIFFDGESKSPVNFAGRKFQPSARGTHELARQLGEIGGQVTYPTLVVLNSKHEIIYQRAGYHRPEAIRKLFLMLNEEMR